MNYLAKSIPVRIPKVTTTAIATGPDTGIFITGIGQKYHQEQRIPSPGYDIGEPLKGQMPLLTGKPRDLMSEDKGKEWDKFEPFPLTSRLLI